MNAQASPEKNVQQYYDALWSAGLPKKHRYLYTGFHYGLYEKGVITCGEAHQNMNDFIGRLLCLDVGKPQKVFDLGCGIGATSCYLSKKYPRNHFTGISLGSNEIELAKKIQKEQGVTNAVFLVGNYINTGFPDNSFDAGFALESIQYAVSKKDAINEFYRLLKPGGKLVIIDGFFVRDSSLNSFMQNMYVLDLEKRALPGYASSKEMRMYLESAGFTDIKIRNISKNIIVDFLAAAPFIFMFSFLSSEIKHSIPKRKENISENTNKMSKGAGFVEMLLGITGKTGYYVITATKKKTPL